MCLCGSCVLYCVQSPRPNSSDVFKINLLFNFLPPQGKPGVALYYNKFGCRCWSRHKVTHLLLSSVQGLLDPLGEDSGSSLQVRAHLVVSHRHFRRWVSPLWTSSVCFLLNCTDSPRLSCDFNSRRWRWSKRQDAYSHTHHYTHVCFRLINPAESNVIMSNNSILLFKLVEWYFWEASVRVPTCRADPGVLT